MTVRQGGFEVGDCVFRWYPPAAHEKFGSGWTGPYLVVKRLTDLVYKIQASKRAKAKIVHVDHLKEYFFEEGKEPENWLQGDPDSSICESEPIEAPADDAEVEGGVPGNLGSEPDSVENVSQGLVVGSEGMALGGSGEGQPLRRSRRKVTPPVKLNLRVHGQGLG